jgi:hypothetical protein
MDSCCTLSVVAVSVAVDDASFALLCAKMSCCTQHIHRSKTHSQRYLHALPYASLYRAMQQTYSMMFLASANKSQFNRPYAAGSMLMVIVVNRVYCVHVPDDI